jgi:hypothetical protein
LNKTLAFIGIALIVIGLFFLPSPSPSPQTTTTTTQTGSPPSSPQPTVSLGASVTITVISSSGSPVQGASISAATSATGSGIYNTVKTNSQGFASVGVQTGCLSGMQGVGSYIYINASGYAPRSFSIPCLSQGQVYPLGTIPVFPPGLAIFGLGISQVSPLGYTVAAVGLVILIIAAFMKKR